LATLRQLLEALSPEPTARGKQFERICGWYLANAPEYRLLFKRVWRWDKWPGRWGRDAGIDLVAETMDGAFWAIQAKAYSPDTRITKEDVDTFLSESSRKAITGRLLIATTDQLGPTAKRTIDQQEKPVRLRLLSDLMGADLDWPASPDELQPLVAKPKTPRPHQEEAVAAVLAGLAEQERGHLVMACGTGKTMVGRWVAERLWSERSLVLLPSLSLLDQTLREWAANSSRGFRYLPVCSDETVGDPDQMRSSVAELGLPTTTDAAEVARFLRAKGRAVVFCTYQSSPVIAEACAKRGVPAFDLVIADEAHRCTGPAAGPFAKVLDAKAIKARRRLFMTATPRYFTERLKRASADEDLEIASMDDERLFGPLLHRLDFSEAIRRDLLSDYQVVVVGVDEPTYRDYALRGAFVTTDGHKVTDARTLASHVALAKAMQTYSLRRMISFHGRVKRAREFAQELPRVVEWMPAGEAPEGALWCEHVSGEMPSGQRRVLIERLRAAGIESRALLANARCLAEGVDVPTLDGVAFIDPRRSQVDVIQAVGRAIRKAPDKTLGTVVVPVFVESGEDPEVALASSAFEPVWSVLKALRAHDDVLAEEFDSLRRSIGERRGQAGEIALPGKIHFDVPIRVGEEFAKAFRLRVVEQTTVTWEFWYGLLQQYVVRKGHALVPMKHYEGSFNLGLWVNTRRHDHEIGKLSPERTRALESLDGWSWHARNTKWDQRFELLRKYATEHGDAAVAKLTVLDGVPLGKWVDSVRAAYKRGTLSQERIQRLEGLPRWSWSPNDTRWDTGFARMIEYVKREGHARVPIAHVESGYVLGNWVANARSFYRRKKLDPARVAKLEALTGWSWNPQKARSEETWEAAVRLLRQYAKREGNLLVQHSHVEDGFALGFWVANHRRRRAKLTEEQQQVLSDLPGWVWRPLAGQDTSGMTKPRRQARRKTRKPATASRGRNRP
jgi:superfamily II DNA or RNA helicase